MNAAIFRNPVVLGVAALFAVILSAMTFAIVPETEQAVVLRLNNPVRTINEYRTGEVFGRTGAGVIAKIPFIDRIVWVDKRVLNVEQDNQQVLSSDQLRLEVDAFARFRVVDPLRMVITAGTEARVTESLRPLLGNSIRNELGRQPFAVLLSRDRERVMDNIQVGLQRLASQYGVEIVDVRIKHADLPTGSPLDSTLQSMRTAREQQAATIRAQGQREAQIIRARADAEAARIYAEAFNKDAPAYDFYRAMQSYRRTFGADGGPTKDNGSTSIILSPDNSYLQQFGGRGR
ncbi:MAG: protease modulator HflC [Sphingomonas bacterium]|uniref:protease modulator HflC n=1 Tax=Sphingomonas bacterium TaxID=1895847 RepID=UPI00262F7045|nr:protease modulator HflC [Sphingomonas bacterium]MDB5694580.1 protease modulator HflC [Sphingomonas bacterium]